jgi:hypothetical protein
MKISEFQCNLLFSCVQDGEEIIYDASYGEPNSKTLFMSVKNININGNIKEKLNICHLSTFVPFVDER